MLIVFLGCRHVSKALKALMKDVQAGEDVDEDELEEMVRLPPSLFPNNLNEYPAARQSQRTTRERVPRKSKGEQSCQIQSKPRPQLSSFPSLMIIYASLLREKQKQPPMTNSPMTP